MAIQRLVLLSLFAACLAEDSGLKVLRGSAAAAPSAAAAETEPSAQGEAASPQGQHVGCTCYEGGECQCARSGVAGAGSEEDEQLEKALMNRTKQLAEWWQAQDEAARMSPWSGPALDESTDLWVAAGGVRAGGVRVGGVHRRGAVAGCGAKGGCGCIGAVGCGCAAKRGCAVAVR
mmetsp:Transcript_90962/g.278447  ORF Transcript_90962/g.278447 Transcript_90962/m.278447 type:complete len:176 (-) Transcript_90962:181-708(-)